MHSQADTAIRVSAQEAWGEFARPAIEARHSVAADHDHGGTWPTRWTSSPVKRVLDVIGALILLAVFTPLMASVALAIAFESGIPVLYRQPRRGRSGSKFTMLKFRTMRKDHDRIDRGFARQGEYPLFKISLSDPRVTCVGRLLRRTNLDELPQLLNVLRGEMSLVGPRPLVPSEADALPITARGREKLTPGITGLWQVSPDKLVLASLIREDARYGRTASPLLDTRILIRTVRVSLRRQPSNH